MMPCPEGGRGVREKMIYLALEATPYLPLGAAHESRKESDILAFTSLRAELYSKIKNVILHFEKHEIIFHHSYKLIDYTKRQNLPNISLRLKIATKYFHSFVMD
jgi:hypothetical protein